MGMEHLRHALANTSADIRVNWVGSSGEKPTRPTRMANFYGFLANFCFLRWVRRNSSDFSKRARFVISGGGSMP